MSSTRSERAIASPFRSETLGSLCRSSAEREYAEPEVPIEELEFFESLAMEELADDRVATHIDRMDGETDPARPEQEHPITRLFRLPQTAVDALTRRAYSTAMALAASAGYNSVNELTNIIFYFRHPHVIGRRIRSDEPDLQRDWLEIRDTIVRPAVVMGLSQTSGPQPTPVRRSLSSANLRWYGPDPATRELMVFMRAVYDRQVSLSTGPFVDTLPESALAPTEGRHQAQVSAARKALELLTAARADLAAEGLTNRFRIGITSGYRSASEQLDIWQGKNKNGKRGFPFYYGMAQKARPDLFRDGHDRETIDYLAKLMKRWIAAPGYSNHQDGSAIDFGIGAAGSPNLRKLQRGDWFHHWLQRNAHSFGFRPYKTEAWHWVYNPHAGTSQQEMSGRAVEAARRSDEDAGWSDDVNDWAGRRQDLAEAELADGSGEADDEDKFDGETAFGETAVSDESYDEPYGEHIDETRDEGDDPAYPKLVVDQVGWGEAMDSDDENNWVEAEDAAYNPPLGTESGTTSADTLVTELDLMESDLTESALGDLAEKVASHEAQLGENEVPRRGKRWTRCFSTTDLAPVRQEYADNLAAAATNPGDRASCIVMLNVALGRLLSLRRKSWPARAKSTRRVQLADLTTHSIGRALSRLRAVGYAREPLHFDFLDSRARRAGTTKPERLQSSVLTAVLAKSPQQGCHYAFALSIMDSYHSVLLVVDNTSSQPVVEWFDQFSPRGIDDVTSTLDERITDATKRYWQGVKDSKGIGSRTRVQIWALRKPVEVQ